MPVRTKLRVPFIHTNEVKMPKPVALNNNEHPSKFGHVNAMEIDDLRRLLASLLETASNFKDVADLDQIFAQTAAAINDASGSEDLEIAEDLCIRGPLSLFVSARAAKDRGKSSCCPCILHATISPLQMLSSMRSRETHMPVCLRDLHP